VLENTHGTFYLDLKQKEALEQMKGYLQWSCVRFRIPSHPRSRRFRGSRSPQEFQNRLQHGLSMYFVLGIMCRRAEPVRS
jgi:hypothetical protein